MTDTPFALPEPWRGALLESSLDCVILMDARGTIVDVNHCVEAVFGVDQASVIGRRLADVFVPPELRSRHEEGLRRCLATGESAILGRRIEVQAVHADGSRVEVELSLVQLQDTNPPLFVGHLRSIAERRRGERRLKLSAAAGELLSTSLSPEGAVAGVLEAIGTHLHWPLAQFWQVNERDGEIVARQTWAGAANLREAMANLLVNAVKFTPSGGQVEIQLASNADSVLITVRDTGQGIPAELLPRIFDRFVQGPSSADAPSGGLGIGLSIVRELVAAHGGTVTAETEGVGRGARFTVRLPRLGTPGSSPASA